MRRRRHRTVAVAVVAGLAAATLTALAAGPAAAGGGRPVGTIQIKVVNVNGNGCRPGTAAVAVSPDSTAFTVTYSDYTAEVGKGIKEKQAERVCNLKLKVGVPKGYTYAIVGVQYRGFGQMEQGTTAQEHASYKFEGGNTVSMSHNIVTPLDGDWETTDSSPSVFEPCGKQRRLPSKPTSWWAPARTRTRPASSRWIPPTAPSPGTDWPGRPADCRRGRRVAAVTGIGEPPRRDPVAFEVPLWRALGVFRFAAAGYATVLVALNFTGTPIRWRAGSCSPSCSGGASRPDTCTPARPATAGRCSSPTWR